jgi:hypothetical protein
VLDGGGGGEGEEKKKSLKIVSRSDDVDEKFEASHTKKIQNK